VCGVPACGHAVRCDEMWRLRHAGAMAWHRGPVRACTRVCWCRRRVTYIHVHTHILVQGSTQERMEEPHQAVVHTYIQSITILKEPHEHKRSNIPAPPQNGQQNPCTYIHTRLPIVTTRRRQRQRWQHRAFRSRSPYTCVHTLPFSHEQALVCLTLNSPSTFIRYVFYSAARACSVSPRVVHKGCDGGLEFFAFARLAVSQCPFERRGSGSPRPLHTYMHCRLPIVTTRRPQMRRWRLRAFRFRSPGRLAMSVRKQRQRCCGPPPSPPPCRHSGEGLEKGVLTLEKGVFAYLKDVFTLEKGVFV